MRRVGCTLAAVCAVFAAAAWVQTPKAGEVLVRLETSLGSITLAIDTARAPITAANFLKYVDGGYYDGGRFHRATRPDNYKPAPPNRPMESSAPASAGF
jgi:peptidyl-prolyl cis-trans isomerase A (cyclophilin A)